MVANPTLFYIIITPMTKDSSFGGQKQTKQNEMKRLFTLIVAMCSIIAAMAQFPMATVSHNGELTQFTGLHALDDALDASKVGDVIYLSEGTFSSGNTDKGIKYGVSVVGCGYNTKLLGSYGVLMNDDNWDITMDTPWLDGVNVDRLGLRDEAHYDGNRKFLEIRNCWIGKLDYGGHAAKNFYINSCFIDDAGFSGLNEYRDDNKETRNVYINNSKIRNLGRFSDYIITTNCNISVAEHCPRIVESCIIEGSQEENGKLRTWWNGTHVINNSLFPSAAFVSSEYDDNYPQDGTSINNCYFENPANGLLDENLNATIDLQAKGYLGQDGTIIGAYGGETPFSELPSVPSIDSEKSSVEYDAPSKKLNVTITVAKD
ncbi:MAG: hypothetical protein K2H22_09700 [Muribaculaceae bacterium]|nr:hypothetical protein [Muribaculaceae bacterium]